MTSTGSEVAPAEVAIVADDLQRTYSRPRRGVGSWGRLVAYFSADREVVPAVRGLSFAVRRGEVVGLIGENGAGKSTTIKMLTGVLRPTRGTVRTLGFDPWKDRQKLAVNVGVVFGQRPQLLWDIPVGDTFDLLRCMYRIPDDVYRYTFSRAVDCLEVGPLLRVPVRLLSLGQRMRCDLAASLLHAPALAFLDEPTIGLDTLAKESVRGFLLDVHARFGMTVVLTTHDLKDISSLCRRILVLDKGTLLYDGDPEGLAKNFPTERSVIVELRSEPPVGAVAALSVKLAEVGARLEVRVPRRVRVECVRAASTATVISALLNQLDVEDLSLQGNDLEGVVSQLYRRGR